MIVMFVFLQKHKSFYKAGFVESIFRFHVFALPKADVASCGSFVSTKKNSHCLSLVCVADHVIQGRISPRVEIIIVLPTCTDLQWF